MTVLWRLLSLLLCLPAVIHPARAQANLLQNPGFEDASVWHSDLWGGANPVIGLDSGTFHSGAHSMKLQLPFLPSGGGFFFRQDLPAGTFRQGQDYQFRLWVLSPAGGTVTVLFRDNAHYYFTPVARTVPAHSGWQQVSLRGGFDYPVQSGSVGVIFRAVGTVWLDDASLTEITYSRPNGMDAAAQRAIPMNFFGIHLNHYGQYHALPPIHAGMLRLWDCGCRWNEVEPNAPVNGVHTYNWRLPDQLVADAQAAGADVTYCVGYGTPKWASTNPSQSSVYGLGAAAPPFPDAWRVWLQAVGRRYRGKIRYYEIWNEADQGDQYSGTIPQMVQLAQIAHDTLKAINPNTVILSPNITANGVPFLDQFLFAGGGRSVDVISWHRYLNSFNPEDDMPLIEGLHSLMENNGIRAKPLWDTEGAGGDKGSEDQFRGAVARKFITLWLSGVSNFNWYCWDIYAPLCRADDATPNAGGIAYRETVRWLAGAKMVSRSVDSHGTWQVTLHRSGGYVGRILWNPNGSHTYPLLSSWDVAQKRELNGRVTAIRGADSLEIGPVPILLSTDVTQGQKARGTEVLRCGAKRR